MTDAQKYKSALGLTIRESRHEMGLSQEELADRIGLHRTYIGGIERGERNVSLENILRIADSLKIRPSVLLDMAEKRRL